MEFPLPQEIFPNSKQKLFQKNLRIPVLPETDVSVSSSYFSLSSCTQTFAPLIATFKGDIQILAFLLYFIGLSHTVLVEIPGTSPFIGPEIHPMVPTSKYPFVMRICFGDWPMS